MELENAYVELDGFNQLIQINPNNAKTQILEKKIYGKEDNMNIPIPHTNFKI